MARQVATLEHLDVPESLLDRVFRPGPTPTSADEGSGVVDSEGGKEEGGDGTSPGARRRVWAWEELLACDPRRSLSLSLSIYMHKCI